jgi:hypothetical protein
MSNFPVASPFPYMHVFLGIIMSLKKTSLPLQNYWPIVLHVNTLSINLRFHCVTTLSKKIDVVFTVHPNVNL